MEELIYVVDEEEESDEVRTIKKQSEMLFVRGMGIRFVLDGSRANGVQVTPLSSSRHNSSGKMLVQTVEFES